MQVPIHPKSLLQNRHSDNLSSAFDDNAFESTTSGIALSFESQIQRRSLREYVGLCRSILDEIRTNLNGFIKDPQNSDIPSTTAAQLGRFCLEADSWGFHSLYDVAFLLQKTLLESDSHKRGNLFWEAVDKGLSLLSALVEQCEIDFRKNLAIDDTLLALRRVGRDLESWAE